MILEAVEDDDLVEMDLPDQLAILKRISQACTQDTKAIRAKVGEWGEYAKAIHRACVEKDGRVSAYLGISCGEADVAR